MILVPERNIILPDRRIVRAGRPSADARSPRRGAVSLSRGNQRDEAASPICLRCREMRGRQIRPYWRRSVPKLNAAGDLLYNTANDLLLYDTTTGLLFYQTVDGDCSCCGSGSGSAGCGCTSLPTTMLITFSGGTAIDDGSGGGSCPCSGSQTATSASFRLSSGSFSGVSACLTYSGPGTCAWTGTASGPTFNELNIFCSPDGNTTNGTVYISVAIVAGVFNIYAYTTLTVPINQIVLYQNSHTIVSGDCSSAFTQADQSLSCSILSGNYAWNGSTASITPNGC